MVTVSKDLPRGHRETTFSGPAGEGGGLAALAVGLESLDHMGYLTPSDSENIQGMFRERAGSVHGTSASSGHHAAVDEGAIARNIAEIAVARIAKRPPPLTRSATPRHAQRRTMLPISRPLDHEDTHTEVNEY
jgi:hypothetical protein